MANALAQYREVIESVTLTMSAEEAETLADILRYIGGSFETSRRKHADAISRALKKAKVRATAGEDIQEKSAIYFI